MLPEDQVNQVQRFLPPGRCTCGGEVKPETRASYRHQVFDVPDVKFTVTEYQVYAGTCCQCRCRSVGKLPEWMPSGQMGAGLISWIALLSGQYRLSTRQIQSLLQEQWHLTFSLGAISQAQKPVSGWLQPIYAQIGTAVRRADIAHADETTHYRGGERRWLWTLCTPFAIYFLTHYSRGKGAAAELLGEFNGILISDRHGGYNDHPPDQRQLCWAHIIRNMERIAERKGQAGRLGQRLVRWARLTIRVEHCWRSSQYASDIYRQRLIRLRRHFYAELEIGSTQCAKTKTGNQCRRLLRDEAMLWTFLRHPGIPL